MQIPYEVEERPDTGLWNAKIGIWLFLASEVMLFGGLFSSYVFLRMGADYPWPLEVMNVSLGFINTLVLIGSSVAVVMAWASLKMRKWGGYVFWMILVLLCSVCFLVIKSFEYKAKFAHYEFHLKDGSVIEGKLLDDKVHFSATEVGVDYLYDANYFLKFLKEGQENIEVTADSGQKGILSRDWIKEVRRHLPKGVTMARFSFEKPVEFVIRRNKAQSIAEDGLVLINGAQFKGRILGENIVRAEAHILDLRGVKDPEHAEAFSCFVKKEHGGQKTASADHDSHKGVRETFFHLQHEAQEKYKGKEKAFSHRINVQPVHGEALIKGEDLTFYSNHTPRANPFYAIYFTMTGLHGLHVLFGALVLAYFLFFGKKMYRENPDHLANRVEVGGLFWHFVDLVWIFLFPVLYLM